MLSLRLTARPRSQRFRVLLPTLAVAQLYLHTWFSALQSAHCQTTRISDGAAVPLVQLHHLAQGADLAWRCASGHDGHAVGSLWPGSGAVGAGLTGWRMPLAHLSAVLVVAALLRFGDQALFWSWRWLTGCRPASACRPQLIAMARPTIPAAPESPRPGVRLAGALGWRGPPGRFDFAY
jgi:hypothetical protein